MKPKKFSLLDRLKSFKFAFRGLKRLLMEEHNARVHLMAVVFVLVTSFLLKVSQTEFILLLLCIGFVFVAEIFNTAIESMADFVEPEWNDKIGAIKDYAAAAVLVSAMIATIIWLIITVPRLMKLFEL